MSDNPASGYSGALDNFTIKEAKRDKAKAAHMNFVQNAIAAVQGALGTGIEGSSADLKTRLGINMADDGTVKSQAGDPVSPLPNQIWVNETSDKMFRRNNADTQNVEIGAGGMSLIDNQQAANNPTTDITLEDNKIYFCIFSMDFGSGINTPYIRFNSDSSGSNYKYYLEESQLNATPATAELGSSAADEIQICHVTGGGENISGHFIVSTEDDLSITGGIVRGEFNITNNANSGGDFKGDYTGGNITSIEIGTMVGSGTAPSAVNLWVYEYNLS